MAISALQSLRKKVRTLRQSNLKTSPDQNIPVRIQDLNDLESKTNELITQVNTNTTGAANYLPLAGGTMTGDIDITSGVNIEGSVATGAKVAVDTAQLTLLGDKSKASNDQLYLGFGYAGLYENTSNNYVQVETSAGIDLVTPVSVNMGNHVYPKTTNAYDLGGTSLRFNKAYINNIIPSVQTIAAGGTSTALSLTDALHSVDADAGGDIFTLADGTIGQTKTIACLSATGVCTITPDNLSGGTSVTLNAAGETVVLQFVDTNWYIIGGNAYTVI